MSVLSRFLLPCLLLLSAGASSQQWKEYADSARLLHGKRQSAAAIILYEQALELLKKDSAGTRTKAMVTFHLADVYRDLARFEKAEPLYLESRNAIENIVGRVHADYATVCTGLAIFYAYTRDYEKAEPLFAEARDVRAKVFGKDHPDYATSTRNLGNIYRSMSKYDKAEPLFLEARKIIEKNHGRVHRDFAASCSDLAILYTIRGEYKKAEPFFLEAMEIRKELVGPDHIEYAASCNNLGLFYKRTGQYAKAEPFLLESKRISEKIYGRDHPSYATDCHNLAALYMELNEPDKSESLYQEALGIIEKVFGKKSRDYASTCNSLAVLYDETGQFEKAEQLYLLAKQTREMLGDTANTEYTTSCINLSSFYQYRGDFAKAEALSRQAMRILEQLFTKNHPEYGKSLVNLALVHKKTGQYNTAETLFKESRAIFAESYGKDHTEYAYSCRDLARLYFETDRYEEAEMLYQESQEILAQSYGKDHHRYGELQYNLATLYRMQKKTEKAHASFKKAFENLYSNSDKYFLFASETEKQRYVSQIASLDNSLLSFMTVDYPAGAQALSYNLALKNRNLVLNSSRQTRQLIYYSGDSALVNLYNTYLTKKEELSALLAKPLQLRKGQDKILADEANELEKQVIRKSDPFKNRATTAGADYKKVKQSLQPGEAAVEFLEITYDNGKGWADSTLYIAMVLRPDRPEPERVLLFEKRKLEAALSYTKTSPGQQKINQLYSISGKSQPSGDTSLGYLVWKPLEEKLTGIHTVFFAPAGLLHKISFAALPLTQKEVVSDRYKLVQLNTTASAGHDSPAGLSASDNLVFYGGVQYNADSAAIRQATLSFKGNEIASRSLPDDLLREGVSEFHYLAGAEKEVEIIERMASEKKYSTRVAAGIFATEESFKSLNGKNSPAILHIATHGFFFPDPKGVTKDDKSGGSVVFRQSDNPLIRSGLALAGANNAWKGKPVPGVEDGILTAYEVANMYFPHTKLAVLSACETGLGDIQGSEGVFGLQRAFKMAGVENLVMSLWRVDDRASVEFMQYFYAHLLDQKSIQDAFYHTQTLMKNKYRNDPYKWAAWVLIR